jgi:hypothetical protein
MMNGINYIGRADLVTLETPFVDNEPIRYPPQIEEYQDPVNTGKGLSTAYSGTVLDKDSGIPLQGASVYLLSGGQAVSGMPTNASGQFNFINADAGGDSIRITHTGYKPISVKAAQLQNNNFFIVLLEKDIVELDPVEIPGGGSSNNNTLWLLLLAGGVLASQQGKKQVGKIGVDTVLMVAAGGTLILGFDLVKKLLVNLGIWDSPEEQSYDDEVNNPYSFWSPLFWQQGPDGTVLITNSGCEYLYNEIYDSFGILGDDESRIYATLKTQSQLSYFSWWLAKNESLDLLNWLLGNNTGPIGDHLSTAEIKIITDYFSKLPKYKV